MDGTFLALPVGDPEDDLVGPIEITFSNLPASEALERQARERVSELRHRFPSLGECRIVVEAAQGSPQVRVRIDLALPDAHVMVTHEPTLDNPRPQTNGDAPAPEGEPDAVHRGARVALHDAFDAVQRRLEARARASSKTGASIVWRATDMARRWWCAMTNGLRTIGHHEPRASVLRLQSDAPSMTESSPSRPHAHEREPCPEDVKKRLALPPCLQQLGTNLNLLARQDRTPPVYGRDREVQQILEALCHRDRSSSVMLLGEPGVGKTAIVEGLARRIELEPDTVPVRLRECQIVSLPVNALVAGTIYRGMFEERFQHVIQELQSHPRLILFIDEAHTLVGAGSALGATSDAANVLKSVLARGEIRVIAATTASEYAQHIQEDEALARRFRTVRVGEPTIEETQTILHRLRPRLERTYAVRLPDETLDTALDLSPRYLRHLRLPDKVIGWLDTAAVRAEFDGRVEVTPHDVVGVIAHAAQIPEDMVSRDVSHRFRDIEARLQRRLVGQLQAIDAVARRLVLNKGPLKDGFDRPDGVLLFLGPTGVGKTELAKALAEFLFGDEKKMVRIDMSEYQDGATAVDKLIGMPRGIVGSQRGGILTTRLSETPYTVLLLDEIEKASPEVLNVFLQAFDEGWLTDGRGTRVYLSDAIVIMTSNVGSEHFRKLTNPLGFRPAHMDVAQLQADVRRELERRFSPEFLNRIDEVVTFAPLTRAETRAIAQQHLACIVRTLARAGKSLAIDEDAVDVIVTRGFSQACGARFLKRTIDELVKLPISVRWRDASHFRVCTRGTQVSVEAVVRPVPASPDCALDCEHVAQPVWSPSHATLLSRRGV